jgi:hypothetical protein
VKKVRKKNRLPRMAKRPLKPRSSRQIKAIDAVKHFGLDKMDTTFDPDMARHRCMGNFADSIPVLTSTTFERSHPTKSLDEETERFLKEQFDNWFPTKTK